MAMGKLGHWVIHCRICKKELKQKPGRGRAKEICTECGQYESALKRVARFLSSEVVWQDEAALKAQKGDIMAMLNQHADKRTARFVGGRGTANDAELS